MVEGRRFASGLQAVLFTALCALCLSAISSGAAHASCGDHLLMAQVHADGSEFHVPATAPVRHELPCRGPACQRRSMPPLHEEYPAVSTPMRQVFVCCEVAGIVPIEGMIVVAPVADDATPLEVNTRLERPPELF